MAKFERGVYEPSDEVRVFDASEDEEDVEGSRLPLLIVLALVVLAMFAGVVYLAYTQGVAKGRGEMPVLAAADGPARVAPQQPGGAQVPYQGFKIYEQPAPPDDAADAASAESNPGEDQAGGASATAPVKSSPPQSARVQSAPAQSTPVKPVQTAAAPPPKPAAPVAATRSIARPAPPAPSRPAPAAMSAPAGVATAAPRSLGRPAAAPAGTGSFFLQIGAYKSQADAETAWKTFQARHATLLSGHGLDVQRVDLGDKGVWYRARVGSFSDRDVALALCDRLKADGGACFLAR
ncbi:MAG TPA: SPOR domain-containing protein [Rhizomicrobium sp.]|jgi:cell division protein FtsN|nr:SPOR domain-containing protein [Rhizomicrobium sp.]